MLYNYIYKIWERLEMKFISTKKSFHEALQSVAHAVSSRSTMPILANVLMEVKNNSLTITATDLEIAMVVTHDLEDAQDGALTVLHKELYDLVGRMPEGDLKIELDDNQSRLVISSTSPKVKYEINTLPAIEYPLLPILTDGAKLSFNGDIMRTLIKRTKFAVATDESRQVLTGCLFNYDGQEVILVATDTHRLAVCRSEVGTEKLNEDISIIIPSRSLNQLERLINVSDNIEMLINDKHIQFITGRTTLISRLIEGSFPSFDRVIPKDTDKDLVVNREDLYDAVHRASIVAKSEANKTIFKTSDSTLIISAESGDVGSAHEEVPISMTGEAVEIAFNSQYVLDALNALDSETIQLSLKGSLNPGLITIPNETSFQYVVMPMQML